MLSAVLQPSQNPFAFSAPSWRVHSTLTLCPHGHLTPEPSNPDSPCGWQVVIGAVGRVLKVERCERVQLVAAAVRICIASCHDCVFYLGVNRPPLLLGDNRFLQVMAGAPPARGVSLAVRRGFYAGGMTTSVCPRWCWRVCQVSYVSRVSSKCWRATPRRSRP